MRHLKLIAAIFIFVGFWACSQDGSSSEIELSMQQSGTSELLVGVSAANKNVVWVGGTGGTILRTTDGGKTWQLRSIPGSDSLQFRDVYAVSAQTAYVLSIGKGTKSRIYKTTDGGKTWTLQFKASHSDAFFDCMAFWTPKAGIAFNDAVDGEFIIIKTTNGGKEWKRIPLKRVPDARPGEASFAASGTCVTVQSDSTAWIGTGGIAQPRILKTTDRGETWKTYPVPLDAGKAAGAASVIFRDLQHGMVLGGDIAKPATSDSSAAVTTDGGVTWKLATTPPLNSPVYGAAYVPGTQSVLAVGPGGIAFSSNEGATWSRIDTLEMWGVTFANSQSGWIVGPNGRIIHVVINK